MTVEPDNKAAIDEAIEVLNRIHAADPSILPTLIAHRVPCNRALADDPTVQVGLRAGCTEDDEGQPYEIGFLGVINGLFGSGPHSYGFITAHINDQHQLTHFAWTDFEAVGRAKRTQYVVEVVDGSE